MADPKEQAFTSTTAMRVELREIVADSEDLSSDERSTVREVIDVMFQITRVYAKVAQHDPVTGILTVDEAEKEGNKETRALFKEVYDKRTELYTLTRTQSQVAKYSPSGDYMVNTGVGDALEIISDVDSAAWRKLKVDEKHNKAKNKCVVDQQKWGAKMATSAGLITTARAGVASARVNMADHRLSPGPDGLCVIHDEVKATDPMNGIKLQETITNFAKTMQGLAEGTDALADFLLSNKELLLSPGGTLHLIKLLFINCSEMDQQKRQEKLCAMRESINETNGPFDTRKEADKWLKTLHAISAEVQRLQGGEVVLSMCALNVFRRLDSIKRQHKNFQVMELLKVLEQQQDNFNNSTLKMDVLTREIEKLLDTFPHSMHKDKKEREYGHGSQQRKRGGNYKQRASRAESSGKQGARVPFPDGVCHSYYNTKKCRFGEECRFDHEFGGGKVGFRKDIPSPGKGGEKTEVCRNFQGGHCRFGDNCRRRHVKRNDSGSDSESESSDTSVDNAELKKRVRKIQRRSKKKVSALLAKMSATKTKSVKSPKSKKKNKKTVRMAESDSEDGSDDSDSEFDELDGLARLNSMHARTQARARMARIVSAVEDEDESNSQVDLQANVAMLRTTTDMTEACEQSVAPLLFDYDYSVQDRAFDKTFGYLTQDKNTHFILSQPLPSRTQVNYKQMQEDHDEEHEKEMEPERENETIPQTSNLRVTFKGLCMAIWPIIAILGSPTRENEGSDKSTPKMHYKGQERTGASISVNKVIMIIILVMGMLALTLAYLNDGREAYNGTSNMEPPSAKATSNEEFAFAARAAHADGNRKMYTNQQCSDIDKALGPYCLMDSGASVSFSTPDLANLPFIEERALRRPQTVSLASGETTVSRQVTVGPFRHTRIFEDPEGEPSQKGNGTLVSYTQLAQTAAKDGYLFVTVGNESQGTFVYALDRNQFPHNATYCEVAHEENGCLALNREVFFYRNFGDFAEINCQSLRANTTGLKQLLRKYLPGQARAVSTRSQRREGTANNTIAEAIAEPKQPESSASGKDEETMPTRSEQCSEAFTDLVNTAVHFHHQTGHLGAGRLWGRIREEQAEGRLTNIRQIHCKAACSFCYYHGPCAISGKRAREPVGSKADLVRYRASARAVPPGAIGHYDILVNDTADIDGKRYCHTLTDKNSNCGDLCCTARKNAKDTGEAILQLARNSIRASVQAAAHYQRLTREQQDNTTCPEPLRVIVLDGELGVTKAVEDELGNIGVELRRTVPNAHNQNGRAEGKIANIKHFGDVLMVNSAITHVQSFAWKHANFILNVTPARHGQKSSFELRTGLKPGPRIDYMAKNNVFGACTVVVRTKEEQATSTVNGDKSNVSQGRNQLGIFLGICDDRLTTIMDGGANASNVLICSKHGLNSSGSIQRVAGPTRTENTMSTNRQFADNVLGAVRQRVTCHQIQPLLQDGFGSKLGIVMELEAEKDKNDQKEESSLKDNAHLNKLGQLQSRRLQTELDLANKCFFLRRDHQRGCLEGDQCNVSSCMNHHPSGQSRKGLLKDNGIKEPSKGSWDVDLSQLSQNFAHVEDSRMPVGRQGKRPNQTWNPRNDRWENDKKTSVSELKDTREEETVSQRYRNKTVQPMADATMEASISNSTFWRIKKDNDELSGRKAQGHNTDTEESDSETEELNQPYRPSEADIRIINQAEKSEREWERGHTQTKRRQKGQQRAPRGANAAQTHDNSTARDQLQYKKAEEQFLTMTDRITTLYTDENRLTQWLAKANSTGLKSALKLIGRRLKKVLGKLQTELIPKEMYDELIKDATFKLRSLLTEHEESALAAINRGVCMRLKVKHDNAIKRKDEASAEQYALELKACEDNFNERHSIEGPVQTGHAVLRALRSTCPLEREATDLALEAEDCIRQGGNLTGIESRPQRMEALRAAFSQCVQDKLDRGAAGGNVDAHPKITKLYARALKRVTKHYDSLSDMRKKDYSVREWALAPDEVKLPSTRANIKDQADLPHSMAWCKSWRAEFAKFVMDFVVLPCRRRDLPKGTPILDRGMVTIFRAKYGPDGLTNLFKTRCAVDGSVKQFQRGGPLHYSHPGAPNVNVLYLKAAMALCGAVNHGGDPSLCHAALQAAGLGHETMKIRVDDLNSAYTMCSEPQPYAVRIDSLRLMESDEKFWKTYFGDKNDLMLFVCNAYGTGNAGRVLYQQLKVAFEETDLVHLTLAAPGVWLYRCPATAQDIRRGFKDTHRYALFLLYVDDVFVAHNMHKTKMLPSIMRAIETNSRGTFGSSEELSVGSPLNFLGTRISVNPDSLFFEMDQQVLIDKVAKAAFSSLDLVPAVHIPLHPDFKMERAKSPAKREEIKKLEERAGIARSLLGMALYLNNTRPEITFAVNELASLASSPNEEGLAAIKNLIAYLYTTRDLRLTFGTGLAELDEIPDVPVLVMSDADFNNYDNGRSYMGCAIFVFGNCIGSFRRTLRQVALSVFATETCAASHAAVHAISVHNAVQAMLGVPISIPRVDVDNEACRSFGNSEPGMMSGRLRYLRPKDRFVQQARADLRIVMGRVPSADNASDAMTKPLGRTMLEGLRPLLLGTPRGSARAAFASNYQAGCAWRARLAYARARRLLVSG